MILEHLLEMEVHQSEEVARLVATVQDVGFMIVIINYWIVRSFTASLWMTIILSLFSSLITIMIIIIIMNR